MSYDSQFGHYTTEQKRRDLSRNPFFDAKKISEVSDDVITIAHREYFENLNQTMTEMLGDCLYYDDSLPHS